MPKYPCWLIAEVQIGLFLGLIYITVSLYPAIVFLLQLHLDSVHESMCKVGFMGREAVFLYIKETSVFDCT